MVSLYLCMTLEVTSASHHHFGIYFIIPGDVATALTSSCINWGVKSNVCAYKNKIARFYLLLSISLLSSSQVLVTALQENR